jgi:c-di-GMP-binding flagellar brake protein YcgR
MPDKPGAEARRHSRRKAEGYTLVAYRTQAMSATRPRRNIGEAVLDISAGGVRLRVAEAVERGTSVTIEIKDLASGEVLHARGDVRWTESKELEGKAAYFIGVQFAEIFTPIAKRDRFFYGGGALAAKPAAATVKPLPAPEPAAPEPRRAERFQVDDYVVTAFRAGLLSTVGLRKNLATEVVDLSKSGAQIVCREKLAAGSKIQFALHLNKFGDTFESEAEVVWVKEGESPEGTVYFTGIAFGAMTPAKQRQVDYMMSWFTSYQRRHKQANW